MGARQWVMIVGVVLWAGMMFLYLTNGNQLFLIAGIVVIVAQVVTSSLLRRR